jgi:PTH1 family peptidyl-tRNA hydrolase
MNYIIVGLGNPGNEYKGTRHNVGADALDQVASVHAFSEWKKDTVKEALVSQGEIAGHQVTLVYPQTFMNLSGRSVKKFVPYTQDMKKLVVVHDDLDLPLGTVKVSFGKSSGGHNGVQSIIETLGSDEFTRVRIGIGKQGDTEAYVLGKFTPEEKPSITSVTQILPELIALYIQEGIEATMNTYNM